MVPAAAATQAAAAIVRVPQPHAHGVQAARHRLLKSIVVLPVHRRRIQHQAILARPRQAAVVIAGVLPVVAAPVL